VALAALGGASAPERELRGGGMARVFVADEPPECALTHADPRVVAFALARTPGRGADAEPVGSVPVPLRPEIYGASAFV
jgi:hypothetical protein